MADKDFNALYRGFLQEPRFRKLDPKGILALAVIYNLISDGDCAEIEAMPRPEERRKAFFLEHMPLRLAEGLNILIGIFKEKMYPEAAQWLETNSSSVSQAIKYFEANDEEASFSGSQRSGPSDIFKKEEAPLVSAKHSADKQIRKFRRSSSHVSVESVAILFNGCKKRFIGSLRKHPGRWSCLFVVSVLAAIAIIVLVTRKGQETDSSNKSTIAPTTNSSFSTAEKLVTDEKSSRVPTVPISGFLSNVVKPLSNRNEGTAASMVGTEIPLPVSQNRQLQQSFFSSKVTDAKLGRNIPYPDERSAEDPACVTVQGGNKWRYLWGSTKNAKVDRSGDVRIRRNGTFDSFFRNEVSLEMAAENSA